MNLRWIPSVCVVVIAAMVAVPVYVFWCFGVFDPPEVTPVAFESAAWIRADPIERHRTVRSQMVDDLIRQRLLDGLNRTEVEQLLGPPVKDVGQAGVDANRWHMAYYIGMERNGAFSLDDELLAIRFDDNGRVIEYRTVVN